MRMRVVPLAIATLLTLASVANAANVSGTVRTYDPEKRQLVLDNGYRYALSPRIQDPGLKAGDAVSITWNSMKDGIRVASIIRVADQPTNAGSSTN